MDASKEKEHQPTWRNGEMQITAHVQKCSRGRMQIRVLRPKLSKMEVHDTGGQGAVTGLKGEDGKMAKDGQPGEGAHAPGMERDGQGESIN